MRSPRHASTNKTQTPWLGATALHDLFQKPSSVTIEPIAAEQIKQSVEHLYRLGVRPVFEAFCAIHGGADVIDTLAAYHRLDPAVVAYLGADRLPRRDGICSRNGGGTLARARRISIVR
jgi:hypothetical protein